MNNLELKERILRGEDCRTEFKEGLLRREAIVKSIVSFANTEGGQLIIGVNDTGDITGIENLDEAMRIIDDLSYNRCEPPVTVLQERMEADNKIILIVNVPKGSNRPYRTESGHYYIRSGNRSRQASREELLRLFQSSESIYFDESTAGKANYRDLNIDYFVEFANQYLHIPVEEEELPNYLRNLRLIDRNDKPTVTGLLFFGKRPSDFLHYSRIVCACIKGDDIAIAPFDKKEITGKIPELIEDTRRFLRLYLVTEHKIEGFASELNEEIPEVALREAIVNAIAHRDYTISAPIRVIIYSDRVEIRTPGKLPNTVTIESIKIGGAHVLRNPTIYNLLYKMGMVTDLGSGVRRIIKLVRSHTGKDADFLLTDSEFIVTLPRRELKV